MNLYMLQIKWWGQQCTDTFIRCFNFVLVKLRISNNKQAEHWLIQRIQNIDPGKKPQILLQKLIPWK